MWTERMQNHTQKLLAKRVLWGILQTHQKMKEYTSIGFKNHPSIRSKYVQFLIQNANIGKMVKLEESNKV